eukprot:scaffold252000_cov66-Attheya_sp.AAC.6
MWPQRLLLRLTAFAAFLAVVAGLYRDDEKREDVLEAQLTDNRRVKLDLDLDARGREGLLEEVRFLRERMLKGKGGKDGKTGKNGKSSKSSKGGGDTSKGGLETLPLLVKGKIHI